MNLHVAIVAAGTTGVQKCLFCRISAENLHAIQINHESVEKYICDGCEIKERFTVSELGEMIEGVDLTWFLENSDFFEPFHLEFARHEMIDEQTLTLGYLDLASCGVCYKEIPRNITTEDHNLIYHRSDLLYKCDKGCEKYKEVSKMKEHSSECGYFCPYEDCTSLKDHFPNKHRPFFCPIPGCTLCLPSEYVQYFYAHIVTTHLLHFVVEVSPPKESKPAENQPDVVAGLKKIIPTRERMSGEKCLYCDDTPNFSNFETFLSIRPASAVSHKFWKIICSSCTVSKKFTVSKLIEKATEIGFKTGVDAESIKNIESFKIYKFNEASDVSDVTLGFLKFEKCGICCDDIPLDQSAEDHNMNRHADVLKKGKLVKCEHGCNQYMLGMNRQHEDSCGKICPFKGCKKLYHLSKDHFKEKHKAALFCPFAGCKVGFLPEETEEFCKHFVKEHLYNFPLYGIMPISPLTGTKRAVESDASSSSVQIKRTKPDDGAGPSGNQL
ncbi:Hypothetical predicted protein [Cloeon dipterum]|uniref:Uncharacterized protein n=1 Tax=Cloeon dipterum TaxID=197152 RepID=A0A8S1DLL2_9INSE|nr:Hypothetical predicted protein [Cloeon dipterum]